MTFSQVQNNTKKNKHVEHLNGRYIKEWRWHLGMKSLVGGSEYEEQNQLKNHEKLKINWQSYKKKLISKQVAPQYFSKLRQVFFNGVLTLFSHGYVHITDLLL